MRIWRFFLGFQKRDFLRFFKMTRQTVVKSRQQKFSPQSFEMSSYTSLSDHCNLFQLFICQSSVLEDLQTLVTHTVLSCIVSCECEHCVRISEQDVRCR